MKFDLTNKHAIITGAGRGIGQGIARVFARQGATVYLLDMRERELKDTTDQINDAGGKAYARICDVTSLESVRHIFDETYAVAGSIDILVNNAGVAQIGNLEATRPEDFDRVVDVNVKGVYHCAYAAVPYMKKQGGGVILNMASVAAMVGIPDRFAYSMSKGAVVAMTLSIARDYVGDSIRCNCISPGRVHTPFVDQYLAEHYAGQEREMFEKLAKTQPLGRMGTPEEIADIVLYLCSDEAAFITGSNYTIDGGFVSLK
jgi:NAD(P)-dependent dehydrogenase (short-subunit alcohol dehydrogenase family)